MPKKAKAPANHAYRILLKDVAAQHFFSTLSAHGITAGAIDNADQIQAVASKLRARFDSACEPDAPPKASSCDAADSLLAKQRHGQHLADQRQPDGAALKGQAEAAAHNRQISDAVHALLAAACERMH